MKHALSDEDFTCPKKPAYRTVAEGQQLCFGMIVSLRFTISESYKVHETPIPLGVLEDSCTLVVHETESRFGVLDRNSKEILEVLRKVIDVQLFADLPRSPVNSCRNDNKSSNSKRAQRLGPPLALYVILYGAPSLYEHVGLFVAKCNLFLQHPSNCNKNVQYRNPHCLSRKESDIVYTHDLNDSPYMDGGQNLELFANPIDLFIDGAEQEALAGTDPPQALQTMLYKHQMQALTFMMQRESGWALDGRHQDMWKEQKDALGRVSYLNTISGHKQTRPPQQFRGGLLIDAPGLGKSLSIIALIASDIGSKAQDDCQEASFSTTLLIVPQTLIQTWKDELQRHLRSSDSLTYCVYYGKDRTKHLNELGRHALVITTYSIVRLDWKKTLITTAEPPLGLHTVRWGRVVLDEAHVIREPSKSFAKSVCCLKAEKRWAVTGTPIQNRLMDLFSLFKFLQCAPFDDLRVFNTHVTRYWKSRSDPTSFLKLKTLVNCISLRRPKSTIELPDRRDETVELEFTEQEWGYYQQVQASTRHKLDSTNARDNGATFLNTLKWINELRLICNHGITNKKAMASLKDSPTESLTWTTQKAQARFDQLDEVDLAKCSNTECRQDLSSVLSSETDSEHEDEPWINELLELWCSSCAEKVTNTARRFKICNHLPRKHGHPVELDKRANRTSGLHTTTGQEKLVIETADNVPSKIKRVVQDLCNTPNSIKSVVFSCWTRTFDILQPQLWEKSIRCVRLDGTLTALGRANVLRVFRTQPDIKVLLATISCGGIGLDLTVASRAYVMEPQWNPMSESQALDRIHRLGQEKEVRTIRYIMRGSFEENVQKMQRRKQELADLTLKCGAVRNEDLSYGRLQYLKELVG